VKFLWRLTTPQSVRHKLHHHRIALETRKLADRRFMEAEVFPWLTGNDVRRLLSIGCRNYSAHYERVLVRRGIELTTNDIDPDARQFGAKRHVTRDVIQLKPSDFEGQFDAILLNGVIGFGLDEQPDIDDALAALAALVPSGAPMVIGWNVGRTFDPDAPVYAKAGFDETPGPTGAPRVTFDSVTHVYDFLRRR
jgi:hypothetical protein